MKAIRVLIPPVIFLILASSPLVAHQGNQDLSKLFPKQFGGLEGLEDIPAMLSAATYVCKGQVIEAPETTFSRDETARMTGTAYVRIDRCFKGDLTGKTIGVQVDNVLDAAGGGWHAFRLRSGEYYLLFLNPWNDHYIPANQFYGALPVSRKSAAEIANSDPKVQLESDLKAGLQDEDEEAVLNLSYARCEELRSTAG